MFVKIDVDSGQKTTQHHPLGRSSEGQDSCKNAYFCQINHKIYDIQ